MVDIPTDEAGCLIKSVLPRIPQQQRSRRRVEQILDTATDLIATEGIDAFSVPRLAQHLGWPRATIYKFFPTPASMLHQLRQRHADQLRAAAASCAELTDIVAVAAASYSDPVHAAVARIGRIGRNDPVAEALAALIAGVEPTTASAPPDCHAVAAIMVCECLQHGAYGGGPIDDLHIRMAEGAARACLEAAIGSPRKMS